MRNLLTLHFLQGWVRECQVIARNAPPNKKDHLMRQSQAVLDGFIDFAGEDSSTKRSAKLFAALAHLRDVQEELMGVKVSPSQARNLDLRGKIVLERLSELYVKESESENGQLRMLG